MRYSLLETSTLCCEVMTAILPRFQQSFIYFSTPKIIEPFYDFH